MAGLEQALQFRPFGRYGEGRKQRFGEANLQDAEMRAGAGDFASLEDARC